MTPKQIQAKFINYNKDKHFLCMTQDLELLHNLCEQKIRGMKGTDYIQPGLLAGQDLKDIIEVYLESIKRHLIYFDKEGFIFL